MDDIYEIRIQKLRLLIDERFSGVIKRFAEAIDLKPPQVHRWFSETSKDGRRMGWESARNIEEKLNLPQGWLDTNPNEKESEVATKIVILHPAQDEIKKAFIGTFNVLCTSLNIEKEIALSWLNKEILPGADVLKMSKELADVARQAAKEIEEEEMLAAKLAEKILTGQQQSKKRKKASGED